MIQIGDFLISKREDGKINIEAIEGERSGETGVFEQEDLNDLFIEFFINYL